MFFHENLSKWMVGWRERGREREGEGREGGRGGREGGAVVYNP